MQSSAGDVNQQMVQYGISFINGMADVTAANHQTAFDNKLKAQIKDYETKFASVLQRGQ